MALKISVEINKDVISKRLSDKTGLFTAETCARYMNPYVPMVTGMLSQTYTTKPFEVTYEMPYAHRQFEGEWEHSKEQHPLATSRWDRATQNAKSIEIAKEVTDFIAKGDY